MTVPAKNSRLESHAQAEGCDAAGHEGRYA